MVEFKEIPIDDSEEILDETEEIEEAETTPEEMQRRARQLQSSIFKRLGIILLILCGIALPLTIISFFYHPGQQDPTLLLIEQITGFVLIGIATIVGLALLFQSKRLRTMETDQVLEPLTSELVCEEEKKE